MSDRFKPIRRNLGLPDALCTFFLREGAFGRSLMTALSKLSEPVLRLVFSLVNTLPLRLRHVILMKAWQFWLLVHKVLPTRVAKRGLSDTLSIEAHAMSNVMWWARFIPAPVYQMRFGLSQLDVFNPPSRGLKTEDVNVRELGVRGTYLHILPNSNEAKRVILWFYGGAFVAGDVKGNLGLAERYGKELSSDVFVVDTQNAPEYTIPEIVRNGYRAYAWLLKRAEPSNVMFFGVSSGGGCALRVLQLAKATPEVRRSFFDYEELPLPQPAGAVLFGPFVSYVKEVTQSMKQNCELDLVVSPRVVESILALGDKMCGGADRREECSPVFQPMDGLCPLCISTSEHEAVYDENEAIVKKAREAGVKVEWSTRPYLAHVYQLVPLIPEALEEQMRLIVWAQGILHDNCQNS
eukprot:TRINITY_DN60994_c0_g1_i1.p1 TRINITY_DN60994_c0_g1~~TRINITY_DN60994_c0_g1_i1.p1  ORF type:complete len:408 (+),score=42.73 TRINITY_DN60994_c0_g1_i1:132-1355(+)